MKEMGGYLPLELRSGNEFYKLSQHQIQKVNCGRAALYAALLQLKPSRVILPYFICPTVKELVMSMSLPYIEYAIDNGFRPVLPELYSDDCVILVNYFGMIDQNELALSLSKTVSVILDHTQAFFAKPVFSSNILNVYSCRKFFGVSDGGYLIGDKVKPTGFVQGTSWENSAFLIKSLECGTNEAYKLKKEYEEKLGKTYTTMSKFTDYMMHTVDYDYVAYKRKQNFEILNCLLGKENELKWTIDQQVPYSYPFMVRHDMREYLLHHKIYVPMIWKENIKQGQNVSTESDFAKWIYHLPIDQRYDKKDMEYLVQIVQGILDRL